MKPSSSKETRRIVVLPAGNVTEKGGFVNDGGGQDLQAWAVKHKAMQIAPTGNIRIALIHGPNLNLLGLREPDIYGTDSFDDINRKIAAHAKSIGVEVRISQSNHEGIIIDTIHEAVGWADAIVINPGAYTHYSYAIADALRAVRLPAVEVHLTNVQARDQWRQTSVIAGAVVGQIAGFGAASYLLALDAARSVILQGRS